MLTPRELTRDPRARRAAAAARDRGFEVVAVSGSLPGEARVPLPGVRVVRVPAESLSSKLRAAGLGGMKPSRPVVRELRGLFRLARLLRLTLRLAGAARREGPFDVVHAHDLDTLPAATLAHGRAQVVYDSHELYTSQELDPPRLFAAAARLVEAVLGRRADAIVTSSGPYADELERRLRLRRPPVVVFNCPPRTEFRPDTAPPGPLRAIYQSAMGPGRPLEDILAAAAAAPNVEIAIRVLGADYPALEREIATRGLEGRVTLLDPVPADALLPGLRGHQVGLIINRPVTLTDELVVPNKLFEYMMAGLAVAVPRLPGLAAIVEEHGVGVTFEPARPVALGDALEKLAADREAVTAMGARAQALARERFNAEAQSAALATAWSR